MRWPAEPVGRATGFCVVSRWHQCRCRVLQKLSTRSNKLGELRAHLRCHCVDLALCAAIQARAAPMILEKLWAHLLEFFLNGWAELLARPIVRAVQGLFISPVPTNITCCTQSPAVIACAPAAATTLSQHEQRSTCTQSPAVVMCAPVTAMNLCQHGRWHADSMQETPTGLHTDRLPVIC